MCRLKETSLATSPALDATPAIHDQIGSQVDHPDDRGAVDRRLGRSRLPKDSVNRTNDEADSTHSQAAHHCREPGPGLDFVRVMRPEHYPVIHYEKTSERQQPGNEEAGDRRVCDFQDRETRHAPSQPSPSRVAPEADEPRHRRASSALAPSHPCRWRSTPRVRRAVGAIVAMGLGVDEPLPLDADVGARKRPVPRVGRRPSRIIQRASSSSMGGLSRSRRA
jgi:hypothetical protein